MGTRRGQPTRFNRANRIRVRDNIKIKHIMTVSPYVVCGGSYDVISPCVLLETVIPLDGTVLIVITKMKDPIEKVYTHLFLNDTFQETDGTGLKVKEGDVIKLTLTGDKLGKNLASNASGSIAILPTYDKRFVLKMKVDESERIQPDD